MERNKQQTLSEEMAAILDRLGEGFVACDRQGRCTYANRAAAQLLQKSASELLAQKIWEVFAGAGTRLQRELERSLAERVAVEFEEYRQPFDIWLEIRAYPSAGGLSVYFRERGDSLARCGETSQQTEEALRESEERFRQMAETIEDVFWLWDPNQGKHLYVSPAYEKLWGHSCESLYEDNSYWIETIHPDDRERVKIAPRACLEQGSYQSEYRIVRPDGSVRWVRDRGFCIRSGSKGMQRIAGISEDITERQQALEALRASEEKYRAIYEQAIVGISQVDLTGRFTDANERFCQLVGRSRAELLTMGMQDITHPDDLPEKLALFQRMLREGTSFAIEKRYIRPDGECIWVRNYISLLRDAAGRPQSGAIVTEDISDRKRSETRQAAQYAVARVLAEATTLEEEAVPAILRSLCESLEWQLGVFWSVDRRDNCLRYVNSWHSAALDLGEFVEATEPTTFAPDEGLPGRILATRQPFWIPNLSEDINFPRLAQAMRGGLRAGFGFPIRLGEEILGVIECFSERLQEPDENLLQLMSALGSQVGQFMERKQTEKALKESQELFQIFMDNSPVSAFIKNEKGQYLYVNKLAKNWANCNLIDKNNLTDFDLFPPRYAQKIQENDSAVLAGKGILTLRETVPFADGEHHLLSFKFPLQNSSGHKWLAGMSIDISDRVRAEEALRQANAELENRTLQLETANNQLQVALEELEVLEEELRQQNEELASARETAEEQWQRYQDLFNLAPDGYIVTNASGIIQEVNLATISLLFANREELVGKPLICWVAERDRPVFLEQLNWLNNSLIPQPVQSWEFALQSKTGNSFPAAVSVATVSNFQGELVGFRWQIRNISQRKQIEEALRTNLERLSLALAAAKMGDWSWDAATDVVTFSERGAEIFGIPPGWKITWTLLRDLLHPEDRERARVAVEQSIRDRSDYDIEYRVIHPDGRQRWVAAKGRAQYEVSGKVLGMLGVVQDISDRKETERALREREQRFSTLFNGMDDWVLVYHLTDDFRPGNFIEVNEQACKKLGYSREELLALSVADIVGSPSVNPKSNVERILLETHIVVESVHRTKDNRCIPVEVSATLFTLNGLPTVQAICRDITERKHAEEALRKSERLYRAIGESIDYGIWVCDRDGRNIYASESFLRLVGITQEQCSNFGWGDVLHPDDAERTIAAWKDCAKTGDLWDIEHRFRGVDGNWHPILARGVPVRDENGEILCWAGINLDISRQKKVEAELRESEERFRALADSAPVIIWVNGQDGGCEFVNKEYLKFFGKTLEEVMGFGWRVALHPDDEEAYLSAYREAVSAREPFRAQVRVRRADGQYRWLDSYALPRFSPGGEYLGYIGTSPDITEIKEASEALRQSEERFRLATRAVAGIVYDWNVQTGEVYRSEGLYELIGVRPEEVPQTREWWGERMHPDDRAQIQPGFIALFKGSGDRYDFEYRVRHENGSWVDVWDRGYVIRNERAEVIRVVGSSSDISDRKRAEEEREKLLDRERTAREEAEAANRIKDEFLAVLSHELRSPLNPILGWTRLLRTRKLDVQTAEKALETIERNAKLQTQLIEDLLDVSRILRGKLVLNVAPVNLAATIDAALETVRLAAEVKGIQIQTHYAPTVGLVSGDPARLQQIIWNLLSNAVKFTPEGGQIEIRLSAERGHGEEKPRRSVRYAKITVTDTGKGISSEFLPHVFEYFRQEDGKTTRKFGGLGLGLAIVRYLAELHGGTVTAESLGEGMGSTFIVRLPLVKGRENIAAEEADSTEFTPDSLPLVGVRVLLVDDEADMRALAIAILEEFGAEVRVAASADEALALFDKSLPDIFISDIGMPDVDGYALMRRVRERSPSTDGLIPAIALTAYAGEVNQQQALSAGFQIHLAKPVEPEILVKAIVSLLAGASRPQSQ